jgi:hypothetical protein
MANIFDSTNYPKIEPDTIIAGDRLLWKRTDLNSDYDNSLYTLSYEARKHGSGSDNITITATGSGNDYLVEVASTATGAYIDGTYSWDAYITRDSDSERVHIDTGTFEVKPDKAKSGADPRSHAKITLDALQATIEGKATKDQLSYSISGRSISKMNPSEITEWVSFYQSKYEGELSKERQKRGLASPRTIRVYF